jgi:hypothetical protein
MQSFLAKGADELRNSFESCHIVFVDLLAVEFVVKLNNTNRGVSKFVSVVSQRGNGPIVEVLDSSEVVNIWSELSKPPVFCLSCIFLRFLVLQISTSLRE